MNPQKHQQQPEADLPVPPPPSIRIKPSSPRVPLTTTTVTTPTAGAQRKIAIAVDLSDESAYAVKWAVQNYLRPGDAVILLHVRPTTVLYGADWGTTPKNYNNATDGDDDNDNITTEEEFDNFTTSKATSLAQPLVDGQIPFKIHIVKDHDMKERLCLEVERLGLSAVIMGSRGFGAVRRSSKGRLGSVSDYCVHHCICPVVVVRYPYDKESGSGEEEVKNGSAAKEVELHPVPEEEMEYHDASDE